VALSDRQVQLIVQYEQTLINGLVSCDGCRDCCIESNSECVLTCLSLSLSLFLFVLRMICVKYFSMRHLWFFECYRRRNIEAYLEYE